MKKGTLKIEFVNFTGLIKVLTKSVLSEHDFPNNMIVLKPKSRTIRVPIVILIHSTDFGLPALSNRNHFGVFDKVFLLQICPLAALGVAGLLNWVLKAARAAAEAEGQVLYRRFVYQIGVPEIDPKIILKIHSFGTLRTYLLQWRI